MSQATKAQLKYRIVRLFAAALIAAEVLTGPIALSADEEVLREPAAVPPRLSSAPMARKRFPGGADEDDLQVQTNLPNPLRGLEVTDAINSAAGAPEEDSNQAPAAED